MGAYASIDTYNKYVGRCEALTIELNKTVVTYEENKNHLLCVDEATTLIQEVAKETQEKVKVHIDSLVTRALRTIYPDDPYDFKLVFVSERGQTSVYPTLVKNGNDLDPTENSGGMAEIIAFALRIAFMTIGRKQKIIVLDEPFTGVSKESIPLVQDFIISLSKDLGIEFIISTHLHGFNTDACKSFYVSKENDISNVTVN